MSPGPEAFQPRGVVHLLRPWGEPAADLEELRERLSRAPDEVWFAHTLRALLRDAGTRGEGMDDLSHWVSAVLQDPETAERMWFAAGSNGERPAPLRGAVLGVLASLPERRRTSRRAPEGGEFVFLEAFPLPYPVGDPLRDPDEVLHALLGADPSVWFHHLHEEPWLTGERAPVLRWLEASGAARSAGWLEEGARAALPVEVARGRFRLRFRLSRAAGRVKLGAAAAPGAHLAAARSAAQRLARRRSREEPRA